MSEVKNKLRDLRAALKDLGAGAVRFRGVDWFSWITGGGSSVVIFTNETGIAQIFVDLNKAYVITDEIEAARLKSEELGGEFEVLVTPWADACAADRLCAELAIGARVVSDRPAHGESVLPAVISALKLQMRPEEIARYRTLGREASEAMTDAIQRAEPGWTENILAAEGARELWRRGIHPTLILAAGEERLELHRHPFPTGKKLGARAMMVFCGRRHGLYANLTRFVSFRTPTETERSRMQTCARLEAAAFAASKPGAGLDGIYREIKEAYRREGFESETLKQHFGGITGYLSRESFARPAVPGETPPVLGENYALAWNPTLPGSKIEDTVLVTQQALEILTEDPRWPSQIVEGRKRPQVLELK